jgi:hypothetical protein
MISGQTIISLVIGAVTLVLSISTSAIIVGVKWGKLSKDVEYMKLSLAKIKGMFQLVEGLIN